MLLLQQILNGVMLGSVYVTVAVAFTLTIGVLNFLNFTIPTLFMLAGMVGWAAATWGLPFGLTPPLPWPAALLLGIVVTICASLIVERFTFRFLKTKYGDATEHAIPLVSSLGFLLIIENLVRIGYGTEAQRFDGPEADMTINLGGLFLRVPQLVSLVVVFAMVAGLNWLLRHSRVGRASGRLPKIPMRPISSAFRQRASCRCCSWQPACSAVWPARSSPSITARSPPSWVRTSVPRPLPAWWSAGSAPSGGRSPAASSSA